MTSTVPQMTSSIPGKFILHRNSLQAGEEGVIVKAVEIITRVKGGLSNIIAELFLNDVGIVFQRSGECILAVCGGVVLIYHQLSTPCLPSGHKNYHHCNCHNTQGNSNENSNLDIQIQNRF